MPCSLFRRSKQTWCSKVKLLFFVLSLVFPNINWAKTDSHIPNDVELSIKADSLYNNRLYAEAIQLYKQLLADIPDEDIENYFSKSLNLAKAYRYLGILDQSNLIISRLKIISLKQNYLEGIVECNIERGIYKTEMTGLDELEKLMKESISLIQSGESIKNKDKCLARCYFLLASSQENKPDSAEINIKKSIKHALITNDPKVLSDAYLFYGALHGYFFNNLDSAEYYAEISNKYAKLSENPIYLGNVIRLMAVILEKRKNHSASIDYFLRIRKESIDRGDSSMMSIANLFLSQNYEKSNRIEEAYDALKTHIRYEKKRMKENFTKDIAQFQTYYELEYKNLEIELKNKDLAKSQTEKRFYFTLMVLTLVLLTSLIFIYLYRIQLFKTKAVVLKEQNEKQQLILASKERELVSQSLANSEKINAFEEITKQIESIAKNLNGETSDKLQIIQKDLERNLNIKNDWDYFSEQFIKIYPGFFDRLSEIHQNLTIYEKRLIAYIKMGLTNKEIERLLNISDGSVKKAKYRLKKNLGLNKKEDLTGYIGSV